MNFLKRYKKQKVYFDNASATKIDDDVLRIYQKISNNFFANTGSIHSLGVLAKQELKKAREDIASLVGANEKEIIFTSGGTESDNLAILGVLKKYLKQNKTKPHIITSKIEHSAIVKIFEQIEKENLAEVTFLSVDTKGCVDLREFKEVIKENTILVSLMTINNEIGNINDISLFAKEIRHFKKHKLNDPKSIYPIFHTDNAQGVGVLKTNINTLGVDLMTFNASKMYGPKGVGALYIKRGIKIEPIFYGGDQEDGLRGGTHNLPAISAFAFAFKKINYDLDKNFKKIKNLEGILLKELKQKLPFVRINGDLNSKSPHIINISLPNIDSDLLVIELDYKGFCVSSRSACKSEDDDYSYVLSAIYGNEDSLKWGSIRISFSKENTKKEVLDFVKNLAIVCKKYNIK